MSRVTLLGVPLDALTAEEAVERLLQMLRGERACHVATPNAEMLVAASRDASFAEVLRSTDLNLPDSVGLLHAARWTGQVLPERVTGVDTVLRLCDRLDQSIPVFLLGAKPGIAERAAETLRARNPRLVVAGTFAGSPRPEDAEEIVSRIRAASPRLLLVAYGAPAQDRWIRAHLAQLPSVRIAMGIGGTFDFLAGTVKRAPAAWQRAHLEWAWRLLQEPKRLGRILTATVVFPLLVLRHGRKSVH